MGVLFASFFGGTLKQATANTNRETGKFFEECFETMAKRQDFFVLKNALATRFIGRGKRILIKSQLDFTLVKSNGQVGFFDCKTFTDHFYGADLRTHQLELVKEFNKRSVASGFVAYFKCNDFVFFFDADSISKKKKLEPMDGRPLGPLCDFKLSFLFD